MINTLKFVRAFCFVFCFVNILTFNAHAQETAELTEIIEVPVKTKDFGYVYQGQKLKHVFSLKNNSNKPITIKNVKNSCGCTSALSSAENILPKDTIYIETIVDTTGKGERPFEVFIDIILSEPDEKIRLSIKGNIIIPNPNRINFGDVYRNKTSEKYFFLKTLPTEKLDCYTCEYDDKFFDVEVISPHFWNRLEHHKVLIKFHDNIPPGNFEKKIVFRTNRSYEPNVSVLLTGHILAPIEAEPQAVSLGLMKSTDTLKRKIRLYSPYDFPFSIKTIYNPLPQNIIVKDLSDGASSKEHWIEIKMLSSFPEGKIDFDLNITATFEDKKEYTLRVGIFGIHRAAKIISQASQ